MFAYRSLRKKVDSFPTEKTSAEEVIKRLEANTALMDEINQAASKGKIKSSQRDELKRDLAAKLGINI